MGNRSLLARPKSPAPTTCQPTKTPISTAPLQRAAKNASQSEPKTMAPQIVYDVVGSGGSALPSATQEHFASRFGFDFSNVRVHTDSKASKSADAVNALAYTVGRDVVFAEGQYAPNSEAGRNLLAHELTHVVQQQYVTPTAPILVGDSFGAPEREASQIAAQVTSPSPGNPMSVSAAAVPMLQTQKADNSISDTVEAGLKQLGYVAIGTLDTILENNWSALGLPMDKAHRQPFAQKLGIPLNATAYSLGRGAGDLISLLQTVGELSGGASLIISGSGAYLAGVATTPEGVGFVIVPVAAEAVAAGATLATHGLALGTATVMNMTKQGESGSSNAKKPYNVNQMNQDIYKKRAPKTIRRVDEGRGANGEGLGEKDQVHFRDGSALNPDGTWKHGKGEHRITNQEREWLTEHGWPVIP